MVRIGDVLRRSGVAHIMTKIVELLVFECMGVSVCNKPRELYREYVRN